MANPPPLPQLCGVGLKPQHYHDVLSACDAARPAWVEVHPQNYFGAGGPPHRWLSAVAQDIPLSFHSTGLSLGSAAGPDLRELEQLAQLVARYNPAHVSDHLSWSRFAHDHMPDLLPMPYTREALDVMVSNIGRVQDRLGRAILIENPSRYLAYACDDMDEPSFISELCQRAGCRLLLDLNNVEVSATNLEYDPFAYVAAIDPALVGEIHLAGHSCEQLDDGVMRIDDHGSPVSAKTFALLSTFVARAGPRPTLIEWDTDVPALTELMAEAAKANMILTEARHARAA